MAEVSLVFETMWERDLAWTQDHPFLSLLFLFVCYQTLRWACPPRSRKNFTTENCTNILVTGGAQGLGKLLTEQFLTKQKQGSVNLIVVDIRGDLEAKLLDDVRKLTYDARFKYIHFY